METLIYVGLVLIILALAFIAISEHKAFKFQKQVNDDFIREYKEVRETLKESEEKFKKKITLLRFLVDHKPLFKVGEEIGNLKVMSVATELSNNPFITLIIEPFMGTAKLGDRRFHYVYQCYDTFKNETKSVDESFLIQLREETKNSK